MLLPTLVLLFLSSYSSAYVCFPPPGPLPTFRDCRAVIQGIDWLSHRPLENIPKQWGRHLDTGAHTERLPRWYYIEGRQPPTTCAVLVDVDGMDFLSVDTFPLRDVVVAAEIAFSQCLVGKRQIGLEFPSEEGHAYAKLTRLDGRPPHQALLKGAKDGEVRRIALPDKSVLNIVDADFMEGAGARNKSESR
ncbi:MAG: hypothetical protein Q9166_004944 [cf. Caloplaca sp. 2 TL-2023]